MMYFTSMVHFEKGRAMAMADMKKDFQKAIKSIRDGQTVRSEYPKAMMTAQQMRKCTATVNCGSGLNGSKRMAVVAASHYFVEWCITYGVRSVSQEEVANAYGNPQYQIRVTY
jgi:hypothetical protein